jgi:hypothetical protein
LPRRELRATGGRSERAQLFEQCLPQGQVGGEALLKIASDGILWLTRGRCCGRDGAVHQHEAADDGKHAHFRSTCAAEEFHGAVSKPNGQPFAVASLDTARGFKTRTRADEV